MRYFLSIHILRYRTRHWAFAWRLIPLAFVGICGCSPLLNPDSESPPGSQILDESSQFTFDWTWLPGGDEILYATTLNSPYPGTPTQLEAVNVTTGMRRVVVAPLSSGRAIISYRFKVQGAYVYFEVTPEPDVVDLYRSSLDGATPPQRVVEQGAHEMYPSPDGSMVAWITFGPQGRQLILYDVATSGRRGFPLQGGGQRISWSPNGTRLIVDDPQAWNRDGLHFFLFDTATATLKQWTGDSSLITEASSRHIDWDGESPFLYVVQHNITRYALDTGESEIVLSLNGHSTAIGWTSDDSTVFVARNTCTRYSKGLLGGDCLNWISEFDKVTLSSHSQTQILRFEGEQELFGKASPTGRWLAYELHGLYVTPVD